MKASSAHAVLATIVVMCGIPSALAFMSPVTVLSRTSNIHECAARSGTPPIADRNERTGPAWSRPYFNAAAAAAAGRGGMIRLAAAREDCKSCMEQELLEQELANGVEVEDRETRRAAFNEVCTCMNSFLLTNYCCVRCGQIGELCSWYLLVNTRNAALCDTAVRGSTVVVGTVNCQVLDGAMDVFVVWFHASPRLGG